MQALIWGLWILPQNRVKSGQNRGVAYRRLEEGSGLVSLCGLSGGFTASTADAGVDPLLSPVVAQTVSGDLVTRLRGLERAQLYLALRRRENVWLLHVGVLSGRPTG